MFFLEGSKNQLPIDRPVGILNRKDKLKRSFRRGGLYLGLAFLSIPVPGFHIVLVPAFLFSAVISMISKMKEGNWVDLSDLTCPDCHANLDESLIYFSEETPKIFCYNCRTQLRVRL